MKFRMNVFLIACENYYVKSFVVMGSQASYIFLTVTNKKSPC